MTEAAPQLEQLLLVDDVAELLQVHRRTVTRMVERGELVPYRFGAAVRFDPGDVRAFLDRNRQPATPRRRSTRGPRGQAGLSVVERVRSGRP